MMRRAALTVLAAVVMAACGGGQTAQPASPLDNATPPPGKPVEITFWHGFAAGANQDATNALVAKFNAAFQGQIHVTAVPQGTYDDVLAKLKAALQTGQSSQLPSLTQVYDIGTRFMIDSKAIQPMQVFIDHDKYSIANLEPNILGYYQIGGKLYSMPWNISTPLLYYNRDAFTAAGLDPDHPPQTLDEIRTAAEKMTRKDAAGNVTQYGFGAAIYGWFLEQLTAKADLPYCNNGNGRDRNATQVLINQPEDVKIVDWWTKMVADGLAINTGRNTTDAQNAFKAGRMAMTLESTGALRGFQTSVKFSLGAGFFPRSTTNASAGGAIPGGASLWIMNGKPSYEQKAAWEFVKFLETPENMAYWHTHTGYFPVDKSALNDPTDQAWVQQYPLFKTAIDQLHASRLDKSTQGCLLGVMPQARQAAEVGIENAILNKAAPKAAMDSAVSSIQPQIDQYNQAVGH
jgi:sn-glycerol 3-phosphate transport system substrate-binding protein